MKTQRFLLVVLAALLTLSARGLASSDNYYLSIPPFTGDVVTKGHERQILVTGFQYPGLSGSATSFYIEKGFDSSSALLLLASISSQTIPTATFYCESNATGRGADRIFTMNFGNLVVDSWQSYDRGSLDPSPVEKVSFTFSTLSITTYPQRGSAQTTSSNTIIFSSPMNN